ncbi:hypothetical protein ACTIVE_1611 [Actinomadura verrucosospora]|uniref:Uncharacterized protein n=1 Tax=Actinomadura verrucosospora TaxID=46165 RepID=A0A7D3VPY9_ACTVE|nr:hypothetical protein ACTIVE_1611 [Actinomadura verrucosospora]
MRVRPVMYRATSPGRPSGRAELVRRADERERRAAPAF